jgi:hypothetical protein
VSRDALRVGIAMKTACPLCLSHSRNDMSPSPRPALRSPNEGLFAGSVSFRLTPTTQ